LNIIDGEEENKWAQISPLTELVMLAMEDVEFQIKCLEMDQVEDKSVHVKASINAMNKAQYYMNQLEALN
jgi:hypothetical protein